MLKINTHSLLVSINAKCVLKHPDIDLSFKFSIYKINIVSCHLVTKSKWLFGVSISQNLIPEIV